MLRRFSLPISLTAAFLMGALCSGRPAPPPPPSPGEVACKTPLIDGEPLCNNSAVASEWGMSHRGSYAQASAAVAGPTATNTVTASHVVTRGIPISLDVSEAYADGGYAIWGSPLGTDGIVAKIDFDTWTIIDHYVPAEREASPPDYSAGISGAYNALDADGNFIVGRTRFLEVYADSIPGDRSSAIGLVKRYFLPSSAFCRASDVIAGMVLTYNDQVAFVSEQGVISVIPRDPAQMFNAKLRSVSLNGADCADGGIPDEDLETVSNSLAADEEGGIYLVTSEKMYRFDFDGTTLSQTWVADYEEGDGMSAIRLGKGSGSTPSLMGTRNDDDRFVVITDGQDLMHLVLFWRDDIPGDWVPLAGKDPRIACEIPVTFGDPLATETLSEQSVAVRGYAAIVVNDLLQDESVFDGFPDIIRNAKSALEGGNPLQAPFGIERFDWNSDTRSCALVWSNSAISIPNGIPTMSDATDLFYGMGQRNGVWGVEGVDFETGASEFFAPASTLTCPQEALDAINPLLVPFIQDQLDAMPGSCENSFYAATEVGPSGSIITGTFMGASKYVPDAVAEVPLLEQGDAGVRQGIDLGFRTLEFLPDDIDGAIDMTARGAVQLDAAVVAYDTALFADPDAISLTREELIRAGRIKMEMAYDVLTGANVGQTEIHTATTLVGNAVYLLSAANDQAP